MFHLAWLLWVSWLFILIILGGFIGLMVGSVFDKGKRSDGDVRNDLPSTIGLILGLSFMIGFVVFGLC
jgi:hypothetical protein